MTADTFAEEAKTKFSKELSLVETIAEHLVLNDASTTVEAAGIDGLGFGKKLGAVIKFTARAQSGQENVYRDAAEEHATDFAKAFNANLVEKKADGSLLPLTMNAIATSEGSEVKFDLAALRGVLKDHAIADKLPKISEEYSIGHIREKAWSQAPVAVHSEIMKRQAEKIQNKEHTRILDAVEKVLEDPSKIQNIATDDPQLAQNVAVNLRNFTQIATQLADKPEELENLREGQPRVAGIIVKIIEKSKEKAAEAAPAEEAPKIPGFVETEKNRAAQREQGKGGAAIG